MNPIAGAGTGRALAADLRARLEARGHRVEVVERAGALGAPDRIVVVGGDGTLNDVVNALPDPGAIPVAQLALGTANMLARELHLPRTPEGVAALVEADVVRRIDVGTANGRRFLMNASCGFDARVVEAIARRRRGSLGFRGYARPILEALRGYREPRLAVRIDGGPPHAAALAIVTNVRTYGGLFTLAQGARCDSGRLVACLFERARVRDLARIAAAGLTGRVGRLRGVGFYEARALRIEAPEPVPVQVDGDWRGATPLEITVQPRVLPLLVPGPP